MLHLLKILFLAQNLEVLLRAHRTLTIFGRLVMHRCIFVLQLLELRFNLFLLVNLLLLLLLELLVFLLERIELIKVLLGLLLKILNLLIFLFNLGLQTFLCFL